MARACWLVLLCFLLLIFFLLLVPIVSFLDRLFSGFLPRASSCLGFTEKKMVAVGFGGGWFGAPLTEKAVSGAGKKWPREGNGQEGDCFWVLSLFLVPKTLIRFQFSSPLPFNKTLLVLNFFLSLFQKVSPPLSFPALSLVLKTLPLVLPIQKNPPLLQLLREVFIGEGGAGCCCAWGAGEQRLVGQWARGFKFWEQHAVIVSCLKGRGALSFGSSRQEEEQCQNDTVQFFFLYIYLFVGIQKWVTTLTLVS